MQTRFGWMIFAATMLGACGGAPPAKRAEPAPTDHAVTSGPTEEKVDCPASIRDAEGSACPKHYAQCGYPEGECGCGPRELFCGANKTTSGEVWQCRPKNQALLRADGCPFDHGPPGMACTERGKTCVYPSCPQERISMVCDKKLLQWIPTVELLAE